jgi:endonuclease YncB( thermonuclease family)
MKKTSSLILGLGIVITLPAMADEEAKGQYSDLQPSAESTIEEAPAYLDEARLIEVTATVEDVDYANRLVVIKGPEGRVNTIVAGEEVRNLDQVEPGDQIKIKYYQSVAVDLMKPGEAPPPSGTRVGEGAATAELGEKPAGVAVRQVRRTVEIISVDPYKKTITFMGPEKRVREVSVDTPKLSHYLDELKDGDRVEVVYTDALAVAVTPQ